LAQRFRGTANRFCGSAATWILSATLPTSYSHGFIFGVTRSGSIFDTPGQSRLPIFNRKFDGRRLLLYGADDGFF